MLPRTGPLVELEPHALCAGCAGFASELNQRGEVREVRELTVLQLKGGRGTTACAAWSKKRSSTAEAMGVKR